MNTATYLGRLGADAELRYTPQNVPVCSVSLAVNKGKNKPPLWIKATFWNKLAESLAQYLTKGKIICVCGPTDVETWINKQGNACANITVDVREFSFGGGSENEQNAKPKQETSQQSSKTITDDDIPF